MSKLSPTASATREVFIDTFCELYRTKPVEKITVSEITRKAGYNRATFYDYSLRRVRSVGADRGRIDQPYWRKDH